MIQQYGALRERATWTDAAGAESECVEMETATPKAAAGARGDDINPRYEY
jgi:hypothetical protein